MLDTKKKKNTVGITYTKRQTKIILIYELITELFTLKLLEV